jgi:hypothetical protein
MWAIWLVTGLAAALFATTTALDGLGFAVRVWEPTAGPYLANQLYPFGPHLNAWAVSFGFRWLAFGLAFFTLALRAPRTGLTWLALVVGWVLWPGFVVLASGSLILLAHFTLSVLGFGATGWSLWRNRTRQVPTDPGRSA